jgi:hypothetical protein
VPTEGDAAALKLACFEFSDDCKAKKNRLRHTVMVAL